MVRAAEPVRAVGRLAPDGSWVGFSRTPDGYRLVFGAADGSIRLDDTPHPAARRAGLVAVAIAFFLSSLPDPPAELEATQADLARLVSSLVGDPTGAPEATPAREALDAIDDGLPGDAVALQLGRLLPAGADAVAILRARAEPPSTAGD
jgi:hypothetical protein